MKVSWKWLNQILNLGEIQPYKLADQLTLAGFELEEIDKRSDLNDTILDFSITANRQDTMYMMGFAREIKTLLNTNFRISDTNITDNDHIIIQQWNISLPDAITDLYCTSINCINNIESPEWLQNILLANDIVPVNTIEDITSFIDLKWGQCTIILDIDQIQNNILDLKDINIKSEKNNHISTWNSAPQKGNKTNDEIISLYYKNQILYTFGLRPRLEFDCSLNTSNIMIITSICKDDYIFRMSKSSNMKSGQGRQQRKHSIRYDCLKAHLEALQLIKQLCQGKHQATNGHKESLALKSTLNISINRVQEILGPLKSNNDITYLSISQIINILKRLSFSPILVNNKTIQVIIPSYRMNDIHRDIDVIEEIGRVHGFEKFIDSLPQVINYGCLSDEKIYVNRLRNILRSMGLHEIINYSLTSSHLCELKSLKLYNPLVEDQSALRTNLIENLIKTKSYNVKQNNDDFEAFEIGKIFLNNIEGVNKEEIHMAMIMGNERAGQYEWSSKPCELTWFQAKGELEDFFERSHAHVQWEHDLAKSTYYTNLNIFFHPERSSILYIDNVELGIFGQIDPIFAQTHYINYKTYLLELNLNTLINGEYQKKHLDFIVNQYSKYPSITRDISIIVDTYMKAETIQKQIKLHSCDLLESIQIFDEYIKSYNSKKFRSLGIRMTYRAKNRTLDTNDINTIDRNIHYVMSEIERRRVSHKPDSVLKT